MLKSKVKNTHVCYCLKAVISSPEQKAQRQILEEPYTEADERVSAQTSGGLAIILLIMALVGVIAVDMPEYQYHIKRLLLPNIKSGLRIVYRMGNSKIFVKPRNKITRHSDIGPSAYFAKLGKKRVNEEKDIEKHRK